MIAEIRRTRSILPAILVLMCGTGFITSLIGLRLESAGATAPLIGLVATAYFAGLLLGSMRIPPVVRRVGHIRAFAAVVSLLSASTLAYSLYQHPAFWMVLRLIDGFCVAGVFVCVESWLNAQADAKSRGAILAAYMIAVYSGQAISQFLLNLSAIPAIPFVASSVLISIAAIPIALTKLEAPSLSGQQNMAVGALYRASPLGLVGVGMTGLMLSAFYALGAVFVRRLGLDLPATALFMSVVIAGGVALQWPLGWLSDRIDRRKVIIWTLLGTLLVCAGLAFLAERGLMLMALGAAFGGLSFALYPLCVAHTNDHLTPEQRVSASGGLVMIYSAGAIAGPMLGSTAMFALGPGGLYMLIGLCALGTLAFALWRQMRAEAVPAEDQQPWQVLPRTSPVSAQLNPVAPEE